MDSIDFQSIVEQQLHSQSEPIKQTILSSKSHVHQESSFTTAAKKIRDAVTFVHSKLDQLDQLVQSATPFNDRSAEINRLTFHIKQNMDTLQRQIASLREIATDRVNNQQTNEHNLVIVNMLSQQLTDHTHLFQRILEKRTETLKQHQQGNRQLFGDALAGPKLTQRHRRRPSSSSSSSEPVASSSSQPIFDFDDDDDDDQSVAIALPTQQSMMQAPQPYAYSQARSDAVETIERTLHELSNIFQSMMSQLSLQGEQLERIDARIVETEGNILAGQNKILDYWENLKGDRWLYMKVFGIVLFFIILFFMFFV